LLVDEAEIHQVMVEIKVKRLPEPELNPQILGLIIEMLCMPMMNLGHLVTVINHQ
jgi:hypothetical protein